MYHGLELSSRAALTLMTLVIAGVPALGQERPPTPPPAADQAVEEEPLPDAKSLFDAHVEAIGGLERLKTVRNRHMVGTMTILAAENAPTANVNMWQVAPDRSYFLIESPGVVTQESWYDGTAGYMLETGKPCRSPVGSELEDLKLSSDILGEANYAQHYLSMKTEEKRDFAGRPAYVVRVRMGSGVDRLLVFDAENKFIIGGVTQKTFGERVTNVMTMLGDYRDIGPGIKYPYRLGQQVVGRDGAQDLLKIEFETIEVNVDNVPDINPPEFVVNEAKRHSGSAG